VQSDDSARAHQRRVVHDVLLHAFVGVVAVDEQQVERLTVE
jgi:hypothetical protein